MISQAFSWWLDGLAAAFLGFERWLRPPRRFQLRASEWPFLLRSLDHKKPLTASIERAGDELGPFARPLLQQTMGSEIEIVVPDTAVLENQLEPLPGESRLYVDNVVRHRIETLFPWRAADTLFAIEVAGRPDGRLAINVRATPRSAIAPALDLAMACGAGQVNT